MIGPATENPSQNKQMNCCDPRERSIYIDVGKAAYGMKQAV